MAQFITFTVVGNGNQYEDGIYAVNQDLVNVVTQSSESACQLLMGSVAAGTDQITITFSTSDSSAVNPAGGTDLKKVFVDALIANPGGNIEVLAGKDAAGDQMYFNNVANS